MAKGKSGKRVLSAPRMGRERVSPAKSRKRWGKAFADTAGVPTTERDAFASAAASRVAVLLSGAFHPKRHSDGETPWQFVLGDYCVRFSGNRPRKDGKWGIYLRAYNVRLATFSDNSDHLREALAKMFDAAHALSESWKAVERQTKGNHERQSR